jgi:hypothetical protein
VYLNNPTNLCYNSINPHANFYSMKFFPGVFRFESPSAFRRDSAWLGAVMLAAFFCCAGCSKSKPPTTQTPPPVTDTNLAAADLPGAPVSTPPPVEIAANPDGGVDL